LFYAIQHGNIVFYISKCHLGQEAVNKKVLNINLTFSLCSCEDREGINKKINKKNVTYL